MSKDDYFFIDMICYSYFCLGRRLVGASVDRGVKPVLAKAWTTPTEQEEDLERSVSVLKVTISRLLLIKCCIVLTPLSV